MHHLIFPGFITLVVVSTVAATTYQKDRVLPNLPLAGAPALGFDDAPVNVIRQGGDLPVLGGSGRSDHLVGPVSGLGIVGGGHVDHHKPINPSRQPRPKKPIIHPKKPIVHPKKPIVHPKKPIVHPKKPIVHPKKPIVHPKLPIVHPNKPIIDPFKSVEPLNLGGFQPGLGPVDPRFKKPTFPQAY